MIEKYFNRQAKQRKGFIFAFFVALVAILIIVGWMYLFQATQSKNMFRVFFHDELIRYIAESALAEWRVEYSNRLRSDTNLQNSLAIFGEPSGPTVGVLPQKLTWADFPQTQLLVGSMLGKNSGLEVAGAITIKDVERELIDEKISRKYGKEFQATVKLDLALSSKRGDKKRTSRFSFEFDLKHACLRSDPANRNNEYSPNAINDYILFVRDAKDEFETASATSLNTNTHSIFFSQENAQALGKIFLGSIFNFGMERRENFVFVNINEENKSFIPPPPEKIPLSWAQMQTDLPALCKQLVKAIKEKAKKKGKSISEGEIGSLISAEITVEYSPLITRKPKTGFFSSLIAKITGLFSIFSDFKEVKEKNKNDQTPLALLGENEKGATGSQVEIQGSVRQRFWQTAYFNTKVEDKTETSTIKFCPEEKIPDQDDINKELYKMIYDLQKKKNTLLMSQPNDIFPYKQKPAQKGNEVDPVWPTDPPTNLRGTGENGPKDDITCYQPFANFFVRSYQFRSQGDLMETPLWNIKERIIHLRGIMCVEGQITIPDDWKYEGKGVLYSYDSIFLGGGFKPKDSNTDGPCFFFSDGPGIEVFKPGQIHASLIAMNYSFPTEKSSVEFCQNEAKVKGNIVADELKVKSMAQGVNNNVIYDWKALYGPGRELYSFFLGGQLRRKVSVLDSAKL